MTLDNAAYFMSQAHDVFNVMEATNSTTQNYPPTQAQVAISNGNTPENKTENNKQVQLNT